MGEVCCSSLLPVPIACLNCCYYCCCYCCWRADVDYRSAAARLASLRLCAAQMDAAWLNDQYLTLTVRGTGRAQRPGCCCCKAAARLLGVLLGVAVPDAWNPKPFEPNPNTAWGGRAAGPGWVVAWHSGARGKTLVSCVACCCGCFVSGTCLGMYCAEAVLPLCVLCHAVCHALCPALCHAGGPCQPGLSRHCPDAQPCVVAGHIRRHHWWVYPVHTITWQPSRVSRGRLTHPVCCHHSGTRAHKTGPKALIQPPVFPPFPASVPAALQACPLASMRWCGCWPCPPSF